MKETMCAIFSSIGATDPVTSFGDHPDAIGKTDMSSLHL